ncbi:hypothetical protein TTHERM_00049120 (macronuclear) [Tetrahymena thermophila SB210]|uniref:Uncharacterized protein n=1 Tax=Tetrahymena thermophila (strain SB210) TaxID=312017 RepID=Q23D79_TETTS|nr:hypothetical protein TTHERM_00049120 [Tetrahymena thermophila SB210]EAR94590.1 hypothetical protein TTHERM_00049120 [Tetrahymena thermophila SB210]|eukprot:XP_001014807.1 hypothetical protein TTHERM_00049120 [Tetrahymena thermophila SB210]
MSVQNKSKQSAQADDRFAKITYDPRFKTMSNKQKKVKIDKRFNSVFTDKKFKIQAKTDKYGNKIDVDDGVNKEMEEYYYNEEEEQDSQQQDEVEDKSQKEKTKKKAQKEAVSKKKQNSKKQDSEEGEEESSNQDIENDEENSEDFEDVSDEENEHEGSFEWNEVSSTDEDIEFEDEEDNQEEFYYGVANEKPPVSENSSSKLALLNYDWININAQDIMLLFNSFKDKTGVIKRVLVYPSEFGLKQMELENQQGPQNIWKKQEENQIVDSDTEDANKKDKKQNKNNDKKNQSKKDKKSKKQEENEDDFSNETTKKMNKRQEKSLFESRKVNLLNHTVTARIDDDQGDLDPVALRNYEKQRMRYYYAVIECDCKRTAEKIYESCDGMEFEMSGMPIDLRFVPEDQVFPYEPKEICDEVPTDSQVKNIVNRSIGHTNTRLTWDQPVDRFKFLDGKMTEKDYEKIDWSKYVAPADDEFDEDELKETLSDEEDNHLEDLDSDEQIARLEEEALRQQQEIDNMNWKKNFDKKNRKKKEGEIEIKFNQGFDELGNKILEKQKRKNETKFETQERLEKDRKKERKQQLKEKIRQQKNKKLGKDIEETAETRKQRAQLALLVENEDKKDVNITLDDPRFKAIYETDIYSVDPTSKFYSKERSSKTLEKQIEYRKKRKLNDN